MMSKKNMLILGGLALGGVGLASMMLEEGDGGDIPQQIKERAGRLLGGGGETTTTTTTTGEVAGAKKDTFAQPDVYFAAFPTGEDAFGVTENQDKPAAQRGGGGGGGGDFAYAESIPYGEDITTKKEAVSRTMLPIAPAGVAAKGAIQAAAVTEAQRVSRAGVAGGGAITSFLKDVGGFAISTPRRIGSAGAAAGGAISSAARGVTGISKKEKTSTLPSGAVSTVSALQRGFARRASGGGSSSSTSKTATSKKSTYVRRSKKGYTYSKTGSLTRK